MDEYVPLEAFIEKAVSQYAAQQGGGMVIGFSCVVEWVDSDGKSALTISTPANQGTHRSMGYAAYSTEWFRDDARMEMASLCEHNDDED